MILVGTENVIVWKCPVLTKAVEKKRTFVVLSSRMCSVWYVCVIIFSRPHPWRDGGGDGGGDAMDVGRLTSGRASILPILEPSQTECGIILPLAGLGTGEGSIQKHHILYPNSIHGCTGKSAFMCAVIVCAAPSRRLAGCRKTTIVPALSLGMLSYT